MSLWDRQCTVFANILAAKLVKDQLTLEAEGVFYQPIWIKCGELLEKAHVCHVLVTFDKKIDEQEDFKKGSVHFDVSIENFVDSPTRRDRGFDCNINLYLSISESNKSLFLNSLSDGLKLSVYGCIESAENREIIVDPSDGYEYKLLEDIHVQWGFGQSSVPDWYHIAKSDAAWSCFESYPLVERSQVKAIYKEFATSIQNAIVFKIPKSDDIDAVVEIISDIRSAVRPYEKEPGADSLAYGSIWWNNPQEAKKIVDKLPDSESKIFSEKFDTLWKDYDIYRIVRDGENSYGPSHDGFELKADELENAADKLLKLPDYIFSESLENILIRSLIFVEVIEYARHVYSKEQFLGAKIPVPLKGLNQDGSNDHLKKAANTLGNTLLDIFYIVVTYFVANIITGEDKLSSWVITVGFTFYRWLLKLLVELRGDKNQKKIDLVVAMMELYVLTTKHNFSASIVYGEFVRVTQLGAVFSPAIAKILERKISRGVNH